MTKQPFRPVLLFLICLSIPLTATAQIVDIPDPNLRAAIEHWLGKDPGATITVANMENLTTLLAPNANISDLTGLEHAINLTLLDLGARFVEVRYINSNSISDFSPLAGLTNLTDLWISYSAIADISPLTGLTNLESLDLVNNVITDISPLAGLTNLTTLWLGYNSISDISPIAGLTYLQTLWLSNNVISDISPVAGLTYLTELWISNNPISDISPVAGLTRLKFLALEGNNISDISPVAGLTYLTELGLSNNLIADISPLAELPNPIALWLFNNSITDISPLVKNIGIGNGDRVYISANPLSAESINTHIPALQSRGVTINFDNTIVPLEDLAQTVDIPDPNLRAVIEDELGKAPSATITVADMLTLTELYASHDDISDLTGLEAATNLTTLELQNNNISDISPVAGLTRLKFLALEGNNISDISALAGLIKLTELDLQNNSISDLSPLVANIGLGIGDYVDVAGNPLNALSINTHIPALQSSGMKVYFDDTVAQPADVNGDGVVNIFDLVSVASQFRKQGQNLAADVNRDGVVNILDLVSVAGMFGEGAAAPSAQPQAAEILIAAAVWGWLTDARTLDIRDPIMERGIVVLQQLMVSLTPAETELLANYPNPFNPETWIPYRLAEDAFVTLTIYDGAGQVVRTINLGHQTAAAYETRSQAIYWDGRNEIGESVASGVYFYHLSAGNFSATRKMLILK